jgi:hypothetical protein
MDSRLDEVRRSEALALLELNQQRRGRAEATLILTAVLVVTALAVALGTRQKSVVLPIPAATLILLALSFQQFADVAVIGAARSQLEQLVNKSAGGRGLIYETSIAGIRQQPPLVRSVRALQSLVVALTLGGLVGATIVAFESEALVWITYAIVTGLAALVAGLSYRDMLRSGSVAAAELVASMSRSP